MLAARFIELKSPTPDGAPDRYLAAIMSENDYTDSPVPPVDTAPKTTDDQPVAPIARSYTCTACGHEFEVPGDRIPANGLLECPACAAQFFAAVEMSAEDRAEAERMEAERREREERLQDLHLNKVVVERRALARIRSYLMIALVFMIVVAIQSAGRSWVVYERAGYLPTKFYFFLAVSVLFIPLCWLCIRKIRAINAELRRPLLEDPETPPDFSTLSDGSQILEAEIKNLEKLSGR